MRPTRRVVRSRADGNRRRDSGRNPKYCRDCETDGQSDCHQCARGDCAEHASDDGPVPHGGTERLEARLQPYQCELVIYSHDRCGHFVGARQRKVAGSQHPTQRAEDAAHRLPRDQVLALTLDLEPFVLLHPPIERREDSIRLAADHSLRS